MSMVESLLIALALISPMTQANSNLPRAGLIMHLDASVGVQTADHKVNNWWDQSGYGQNMAAEGSPRLVYRGPNGKPAIELNHLTDKLLQPQTSNLPRLDNDRTLVILTSSSNTLAKMGYGGSNCGGAFGLIKDAGGYSALTTGCDDSKMHAQGTTYGGEWNLHVLMLRAGTFTHLRDGKLVDGRNSRFTTAQGPFEIGMLPLDSGAAPGGTFKVATVIAYNWALGTQDLEAVHRYIGHKWFNSASRFGTPPNLQQLALPKPAMQLSSRAGANQQLELTWRVSFADECRADNGWTQGGRTSGQTTISNPQLGASYGLNCWNRNASANANFADKAPVATNTQPVRISWQAPSEQGEKTTGYRLFVGERPRSYSKTVEVRSDDGNSHTLELPAGSYFIAMSSIGESGRESPLSSELSIRIN